jgi:transcriptional regulator with XRE-family HTH domain
MGTGIRSGYGARIRTLRQTAGLSQLAFARLVFGGAPSARNVSRLEREEVTPRASTLTRIAQACNVDAKWLAQGDIVCATSGQVVRLPQLGERIRVIRTKRGMSRLALARKSGLGESTRNIERIESCEVYPRLATVRRVADALNVPPHVLLPELRMAA